jgi:hypothetical protein
LKNNEILQSNLLHEKEKTKKLQNLNKNLYINNQYLEGLVKAYRTRKIVKTADVIQKVYHYSKSRLKNIFNPKKEPIKPEPNKTTPKKEPIKPEPNKITPKKEPIKPEKKHEYSKINCSISIYYTVNKESEIEDILKHYESISYESKKLVLLLSDQFPNHLIKNIYQSYANNEVSVYSLNYLLNQDGVLSNNTPYFVFSNIKLMPDFIERGLLCYSYIEKNVGITLKNYTSKKVKSIENVLFSNINFNSAFNKIFKDTSIELPIYTIESPGRAKKLVISYCFPPYVDSSGNVMAKRVRKQGEVVDVVQNDMSDIRDVDKRLNLITEGLVEDRFVIDSISIGSFGNWDLMYDFCRKGMEKIEENVRKKGEYEEIYSRAFLPASHFLAFECKLKYPRTKWVAEFSDPVLYDENGEMRYSKLNDQEFLNKVNRLLSEQGFPEDKEGNIFFLCEYLPYIFADEIVFTNENQKRYMTSKFPIQDIVDIVDKKSLIERHPTLKEEFYDLIESEYVPDDNYVNLAYFGRDYGIRNLNDVFQALSVLNNDYRNKCRIHIFTYNVDEFKKSIEDDSILENLEINPYVSFLEYLNLTTKFDCLIVNDAHKEGINPYLPSKFSDYIGSGNNIWAIYEEGSTLSKLDLKYKSIRGNINSIIQTLEQIIKDHTID